MQTDCREVEPTFAMDRLSIWSSNPAWSTPSSPAPNPYEISISIKKLDKETWGNIKKDCSSSIDSLIDLLGGRLSDGVMQRLTDKKSGCFPSARQIEMDCSCPDWSMCCKHIAAVMYAIGSRLDSEPDLLFLLRGVNQEELISQAISKENLDSELAAGSSDIDKRGSGLNFRHRDGFFTASQSAATKSKSKSSTQESEASAEGCCKKEKVLQEKSRSQKLLPQKK